MSKLIMDSLSCDSEHTLPLAKNTDINETKSDLHTDTDTEYVWLMSI